MYNPSGTITKVTRNALGARGIDRISITENSATTHGYPLYDGHGNCRAILTRDGTDDYATGNWRTYDVWGSVRSGSATGDPKSRYVASIGHVADDESSLIYMRARYYEPATGRFLSEDPAMEGKNWYVYCRNSPNNFTDYTGRSISGLALPLVEALVLIGYVTGIIMKLAYQYITLAGFAYVALQYAGTLSQSTGLTLTVAVLGWHLPEERIGKLLHKLGFKDWSSKITAGRFGSLIATTLAYALLVQLVAIVADVWVEE